MYWYGQSPNYDPDFDAPAAAELAAIERKTTSPAPCPACRGTGGGEYNDCSTCAGNGVV